MIEFYLLPDMVDEFKKAFNRLTKRLTNPPIYEIGEVEKILTTKAFVFEGDVTWKKSFLNLQKVLITNIHMEGWDVVATIYHQENVIKMINKKLFKHIPPQFGLNYTHCDHCGRNESRRKISHIIHKDGEWRQIGSACFNALFEQGKQLTKFATEIHEVICLVGCYSGAEESDGAPYRIPTHYHMEAIPIANAIECVANYRKNYPTWVKTTYIGRERVGGTNDILQDEWSWSYGEFDKFADIDKFVKELPENEFNDKIKEAFECGYIPKCEMFIAFFAHKMWEDAQSPFGTICNNLGIKKGEDIEVTGKIISIIREEDPYSYFNPIIYVYTILGDNGVTYIKESTSGNVFDKYIDNDGRVNCRSVVGYISFNKRTVNLKGRLKKI